MRNVLEIEGRRLPMLRWSAVRMVLGIRRLQREWQVGDGREAALEEYVLAHVRAGDLDGAIARSSPRKLLDYLGAAG
jgi:hypothetical protein